MHADFDVLAVTSYDCLRFSKQFPVISQLYCKKKKAHIPPLLPQKKGDKHIYLLKNLLIIRFCASFESRGGLSLPKGTSTNVIRERSIKSS